eukprot:symbB.v1.2.031208.t1/scaffold3597.1/size53463/1
MRSVNLRNVQISACKGIWATGSGNTSRLSQGFREVDHVIMIFTSAESRTFLGYARMLDEPDDRLFPGIWGEFSSHSNLIEKQHPSYLSPQKFWGAIYCTTETQKSQPFALSYAALVAADDRGG